MLPNEAQIKHSQSDTSYKKLSLNVTHNPNLDLLVLLETFFFACGTCLVTYNETVPDRLQLDICEYNLISFTTAGFYLQ
jgi:hypothetical protein